MPGRGCRPPANAASARYSRISRTSVRMRASASLRANAGIVDQPAAGGPGLSAAAVAISSAITCSAGALAPPPRSNSSRYFATVQPSSICADHVGLGHPDVVEEHLVLHFLARGHHQRADLDARRGHVDQDERDALLFAFRARRADQGEHPVRLGGVGGPDLAAGADQVVRRHRRRPSAATPGPIPTPVRSSPGRRTPRRSGCAAGRSPSAPGVPKRMIAWATILMPIGDSDGAPARVDSRLKM